MKDDSTIDEVVVPHKGRRLGIDVHFARPPYANKTFLEYAEEHRRAGFEVITAEALAALHIFARDNNLDMSLTQLPEWHEYTVHHGHWPASLASCVAECCVYLGRSDEYYITSGELSPILRPGGQGAGKESEIYSLDKGLAKEIKERAERDPERAIASGVLAVKIGWPFGVPLRMMAGEPVVRFLFRGQTSRFVEVLGSGGIVNCEYERYANEAICGRRLQYCARPLWLHCEDSDFIISRNVPDALGYATSHGMRRLPMNEAEAAQLRKRIDIWDVEISEDGRSLGISTTDHYHGKVLRLSRRELQDILDKME